MGTKIKTMRETLIKIGNKAESKYDTTDDLKAGFLAVKAFAEATKTSVAQVRYKDKTGTPIRIDFLEE